MLLHTQYPPVSFADSVSAAASVGAIGFCPMVATGNPHPLGKGAFEGLIIRFCGEKKSNMLNRALFP